MDPLRYTRKRIGFLAQELQAYYPELVREDGDGMLSINYTGLIPVIVEAIKEQDKIINELKQEVKSLQSAMLSIGVTREELIASLKAIPSQNVLFYSKTRPIPSAHLPKSSITYRDKYNKHTCTSLICKVHC